MIVEPHALPSSALAGKPQGKSRLKTRRARGRAFEFWIRDYLQSAGWSVHLCGRKAMMIRDRVTGLLKPVLVGDDILGCDGVAVKLGEKTLFFQATLASGKTAKLSQVTAARWDLDHQDVQLWMKRPNGEIEISRLLPAGTWQTLGQLSRKRFIPAENHETLGAGETLAPTNL